MTPSEFNSQVSCMKTRSNDGVRRWKRLMVSLAVLIQYTNVTDGRTTARQQRPRYAFIHGAIHHHCNDCRPQLSLQWFRRSVYKRNLCSLCVNFVKMLMLYLDIIIFWTFSNVLLHCSRETPIFVLDYNSGVSWLIFNVRQYYCARYWHRLDVCLSVCPFVRPSHAGIVSKRLNISSNCLHCLVAVAPWF